VLLHLLAGLALMGALACGVEQAESCKTYESCIDHYASEFELETTPDLRTYQADGDCWIDAATARDCAEECQETTEALDAALTLAGKDRGPCES